MAPLIVVAEIAVPALIGALASILAGHRHVQRLREMTGDDSTLTNILSGNVFRRASADDRKAA